MNCENKDCANYAPKPKPEVFEAEVVSNEIDHTGNNKYHYGKFKLVKSSDGCLVNSLSTGGAYYYHPRTWCAAATFATPAERERFEAVRWAMEQPQPEHVVGERCDAPVLENDQAEAKLYDRFEYVEEREVLRGEWYLSAARKIVLAGGDEKPVRWILRPVPKPAPDKCGTCAHPYEPKPEQPTFMEDDWIVEPLRSPHPFQFVRGVILSPGSRPATLADYETTRHGVKVLLRETNGTMFPYSILINKKQLSLPSSVAVPLSQFMDVQIAPEGLR